MKDVTDAKKVTLVQKMLQLMTYFHPSSLWSKAVLTFLPLLFVIALFQVNSHQSIRQNEQLNEKIFASTYTIRLIAEVKDKVRAVESNARAYRLSPNEVLYKDLSGENKKLELAFDELWQTIPDSNLRDDFKKLRLAAIEKTDHSIRRTIRPETITQSDSLNLIGKTLMDSVNLIGEKMISQLENRLQGEVAESKNLSLQGRMLGDISSALGLILTMLAFYFLVRQLHEKEKIQLQINDLYDHAPVGYHSTNAKSIITEINQTELDWLGYRREEVVGKMSPLDFMDESSKAVAKRYAPVFFEKGSLSEVRVIFRKKSGEALPVIISGNAIFDSKGKYHGARSVVMDYSEQKQIRDDLYENAPVGYVRTNEDNVILEVNQTVLNWLGYSKEEIIGMTGGSLLDEQSIERVSKFRSKFLEEGSIHDIPINMRKKSGEYLPLLSSAKALFDKNGKYLGNRSVLIDYSVQKQLQDDLYENAPVGYHSLNPEGIFIAMNKTELDWLGYTTEEVVGKMSLADLLDDNEKAIFRKDFPGLFEPGKPFELRLQYRKKNGEWLPVLSRTMAAFDSSGQFLRTRTTVFDMTVRKKLEEEIAEARAAERTALLKEQFMANMSHEIRTPLSVIMGYSQLLAQTSLTPNQKNQVQAIETSSESLLSLVNDILDFSKIEAGMLRIEAMPFSLQELLHSVEEMFRQRAEKKNLSLLFQLQENAPHLLLGDPMRLTQVLANLLSNAIKFTEAGSIKVLTQILKENEDSYLVQFSISDTGIGIPPEKQEEIFERFQQVNNETTRRFGGSGLGLSIVKRLVELQGGNIRLESKPGSGSTFFVTLPYSRPTIVPVTFEKSDPKPYLTQIRNAPLHILVAEDNPMNQRLVEEIFTAWNFDFQIVQTGGEAVEALRNSLFDLVILDIQMPEMDGYQAAQIIRHELNSKVPILAMTAHAFPGEREKCLALGMDGYISKPFKIEELKLHIFKLIAQKQSESLPNHDAFKPEKLLQFGYLHEVSGGKKEFIKEMGEIFLRQIPRELAILNQATAEQNWEEVSRTAHGMKSTLGFMGLPESAILMAEKLEAAAKQQVSVEYIQQHLASLRQLCEHAMDEVKKTLVD